MINTRIPVTTVAELDTLDHGDMVEGYLDGRANDPEPGHNRSKAYWHGWRNGRVDGGHAERDHAMMLLMQDIVATEYFARKGLQ